MRNRYQRSQSYWPWICLLSSNSFSSKILTLYNNNGTQKFRKKQKTAMFQMITQQNPRCQPAFSGNSAHRTDTEFLLECTYLSHQYMSHCMYPSRTTKSTSQVLGTPPVFLKAPTYLVGTCSCIVRFHISIQ